MSYSCLKCDNEVDGETCPRVNSSIDDEGFYKSHCLCELCYMKTINFIAGHEHFSITPKLVVMDNAIDDPLDAEYDPDDVMIASGSYEGHDAGCIIRSIAMPDNGCTCKALIDPPACAGKKDNGGV